MHGIVSENFDQLFFSPLRVVRTQPAAQAVPPQSTLQLMLQWYMRRVHVPLLLNRRVQLAVLLAFLTSLCLSLVAIPHVSVGLDQAVALPRDSYLQVVGVGCDRVGGC